MKKFVVSLVLLVLVSGGALILTADLVELTGGQYGVKFSSLPPFMGGGLSEKIIEPGEKEYVYAWQELFVLDTTVQSITWGGRGEGNEPSKEDFVETRSIDGNEVRLAMTIQYSLDPVRVPYLVKNVSPDMDRIAQLVKAVSRADIRTHMNSLDTRDFFDSDKRDQAVVQVERALNNRLQQEGIIVQKLIFHGHQFERQRADGSLDRGYQEQLDQEQSTIQKVKEEEQRINVVTEQKLEELEKARGKANQKLAKAEGELRQAQYRGDQYLKEKTIESERIRTVGENELAALKKQIEALNGPGGEALLKMEIAKELLKSNPKFLLLNSAAAKGGGIDVNRIDTNELIRQAGVFSAVQAGLEKENTAATKTEAKASTEKGAKEKSQ